MQIIIGSDHFGRRLLDGLIDCLEDLGHEVMDIGSPVDISVDYPDITEKVTLEIDHQR